jgi:GNAT superfamily N-acetyltransferase
LLVAASVVSPLLRLESLARRIFGDGDRADGWFQLKLHRECVDATLSRVLVRDDADPSDPDAWLGYALVGRPPSLPFTARTVGIGLVPEVRGHGHGRALVHAIVDAAREHGFRRLIVPAERSVVPFYARLGFQQHRRVQTLLHFGTGSEHAIAFGTPSGWDDAPGTVVAAWLREAWNRTDPALRGTARCDGSTFHVAREGVAIVCHRCVVDPTRSPERAAATFDALRNLVRDGTPLIVVHGDAVSSITAALHDRGWVAVQHASTMHLDLDRVDKSSMRSG